MRGGELAKKAAKLNLQAWSKEVVGLYLGNTTIETVLSAAKGPDPKIDCERHCEAYFYLGEEKLGQGKRSEAATLFQKSIETGITNFIDNTGTRSELKRLTPGQPAHEVGRE
jgi:lipoprotein NlpI